MKLFEFTAKWNVVGGYQCAIIYVNAETIMAAKRIVKSKFDKRNDFEEFYLNENYNEHQQLKNIPKNCIMIWYFDRDKNEHRDVF